MKLYIASHSKELANAFGNMLPGWITTTSTWHHKDFHPTERHTEAERFDIAIEDANDIRRADALVLLSGPSKYSGGKFVEAGLAYGFGKAVYFFGRRENMLTYLFQPWPGEWIQDEGGILDFWQEMVG